MVAATRRMTAEDLLLMPDDGFRYELVRGELRKMSPAGHVHGEYAGYMSVSMGYHVLMHNLGKIYVADAGFQLAPDHVRVPDLAFVRRERADAAINTPGYFPGPPDVAVEVISPSDRYTEVAEKVVDYLDAGTLAVAVVNPRNRINIVALAICAAASGADSRGGRRGVRQRQEGVAGDVSGPAHVIPSHDACGRFFAIIDAERFQRLFIERVREVHELTKGQVVAIDGKTPRRSHDRRSGESAVLTLALKRRLNICPTEIIALEQ